MVCLHISYGDGFCSVQAGIDVLSPYGGGARRAESPPDLGGPSGGPGVPKVPPDPARRVAAAMNVEMVRCVCVCGWVPVYRCTDVKYWRTSVPVYQCTDVPVYRCTDVRHWLGTSVPMYRRKALAYQCTSVPVYRCTGVPVYRCTDVNRGKLIVFCWSAL